MICTRFPPHQKILSGTPTILSLEQSYRGTNNASYRDGRRKSRAVRSTSKQSSSAHRSNSRYGHGPGSRYPQIHLSIRRRHKRHACEPNKGLKCEIITAA